MNNINKDFFINDADAEELILEEKKSSASNVLYEDITKRGKNTKHFRLQNGNFMAVMYDHPVHKFDFETGKYVEKVLDVNETDNDYEATTDRFKVRMPKKEGKDSFVTVEKEGRGIAWKFIPKGASERNKSMALLSRRTRTEPWDIDNYPSVRYEKADKNIDLQYDISENEVKESIVLFKDPGYNIFTFQVKFNGLIAILSEDNKNVDLVRDDEELHAEKTEMKIPPAFMKDANEAFCDDIHYEIRNTDEGTFLDLVLDSDWLSDPERAYPVLIDPRVEISHDADNTLRMVELSSDGSVVSDTDEREIRRVGVDSCGNVHRIYFDFDLPEMESGSKITSAGLLLHQSGYASCGDINDYEIDSVQLNGHKVGDPSFTWENVKDLPIQDTIDVLSGSYRRAENEIEIDLTKTIRSWYADTSTSHCIMIKKVGEECCCGGNNCYATYIDLYSLYGDDSYKPKLFVEYANKDMYTDHQKYHVFDNGIAGSGFINLFNGDFLFAHNDIALKSAKLPLSVSHLYRPDFNDTKYGMGWKLSVEQTVEIMSKPDIYAVYTDAEGKRHYFEEDSDGLIKDDAGLGLTFVHECGGNCECDCDCDCDCECDYIDEACCSITDEQGNKMQFNENGKLIRLSDVHGNTSHLTYTDGNLTKVTDGNGNIAVLNYNNNKLHQIIDADGDTFTFVYNGELLINIVHPSNENDLRTVSFEYSNGKLSRVTDISGISYQIYYDSEGRVSKLLCGGNTAVSHDEITETDTTLFDDEIKFEYRGSSTAVTNNRTKIKNVYKFDANGRVLNTYEDLTEVADSASRSETTVTEIFDYKSIMNVDETNKMGKYRSLTVAMDNDANNEVNFLKNGLFEDATGTLTPNGWSVCGAVNGESGVSTENYLNGKKSYYFSENNTETNKYISQTVALCNCNTCGNILVASAWAKASEQAVGSGEVGTAKFRLCLKITYEDGETEEYFENYDSGYHGWQYAAIPFVLDQQRRPVDVTVKLDFSSNKGSCYFTNVRLVSTEGDITTNTYRKNGEYITAMCICEEDQYIKLISTKQNSISTTIAYQNANSDVVYTVIIDKDGNTFENLFKYDDKHNIIRQLDYRGIISEMTYNSYGKELTRKIYHKYSPNAYMYSEYTYDDDQFLKSERDPRYSYDGSALVKSYTHDSVRGLLTQETDLNGQTYQHTYDSKTDEMKMLASTASDVTLKNDYSYKRGYLTQIGHNNFTYAFDFDALGRSTAVSIAGSALFEKAYQETNTSETVTTAYAGGEETTVISDIFGQVTRRTYKGKNDEAHRDISSSEYDHAGRLVKNVDFDAGICYNYKYNSYGQVIEIKETDLNGTLLRTNTFAYDSKKRLSGTTYGELGQTYRPIYEKDSDEHEYPDNAVVGVRLDGKFTDRTVKDGLGRVKSRTLNGENCPEITENYSYIKTGLSSGQTIETGIVSESTFELGNTTSATSYTYAINGNIETVTVDGELAVKYYYDKWNRIVREDNHKLGKTCTWEYDVGGNITEKRMYALCTTEAVGGEYTADTYVYATNGWNDQLVSFNSETCVYDALGNPTTYRGKALEWTKVRRLAKFGDVEFTYNADGLRTSKKVNGVTYSYLLSGSKILQETFGSSTIKYYYGHGDIVGFNYNGVDYYYRKNLQGDIIEIYTASGTKVAGYEYDAWGNHKIYDANGNEVTSETHIGYINPIRYRGYYYDVETGLYYVSNRYYDAEVGRWINADSVIAGVGGEIQGYNQFAYCLNNPKNMVDLTGNWPSWGQVLGAVTTVVATALVVAAVVAAAPVVAGTAMSAAIYYGAGVAAANLLATSATVGCVFVAGGVALTGTNRAVETLTGTNYAAQVIGEENYENIETVVNIAATAIVTVPQTMSYPSTGRSEPQNLNEQVGMNFAKANAGYGKVIQQSLSDPRMPGWLGWQKYQINYPETGVNIHYVGNKVIPLYFDFKFKN